MRAALIRLLFALMVSSAGVMLVLLNSMWLHKNALNFAAMLLVTAGLLSSNQMYFPVLKEEPLLGRFLSAQWLMAALVALIVFAGMFRQAV